MGRVAQKPSETRVEQTATKEAGGQGREDAADRTEAKTEAGNGGKKGIGPTPIPQTKEIVVVGDSIARGIGARLREQHGNVRVFAKGGGTLADAEQKVDEVVLTGDEAVLVMTGGNDIDRGNGTEEVLERYERVVATLRSRGVKSIRWWARAQGDISVGMTTARSPASIRDSVDGAERKGQTLWRVESGKRIKSDS